LQRRSFQELGWRGELGADRWSQAYGDMWERWAELEGFAAAEGLQL